MSPRKIPVRMSECRACSFPIIFATTRTGTAMPLDPIPVPAGNVACRLIGGRLHGRVLKHDEKPALREVVYMPHAATCEDRPKSERKAPDERLF